MSNFYKNNPRFRCRDKDGREIARLSYAWPEVQEHMLSLYEEAAEYDIDGLNLIFIRGLPLMLYEEPLLKGFKSMYGDDPLKISENDKRFLEYRASVITDFMRKIRQRMDQIRKKQGKEPLEISVITPANQEVNHFFGLDVRTWAEEGLVNIIAPDFSLQNLNHNENPANLDMVYYSSVVKGTDCRLTPRLFIRNAHEGIEYMSKMYASGADSAFMWDASHYFQRPSVWEFVRKFGHKELVRQWARKSHKALPKEILLKSLGGFVTDKYSSHMAF